MSDVVFVTPNWNGYVREEPVGTLLLATILKNSGIEAQILQFYNFGDVSNFPVFLNRAIERIRKENPRIVSFYTRCDSYHISLKIAQLVKTAMPDTYVVFGGSQSDLTAADTLQQIEYVDYICCGEGETTIVPFFASLLCGEPDHSIRGLAYRRDGQVILNPRPELLPNLDSLPAVDYSLLDFRYEERGLKVKQLFPVDVGRGCPFSCTFCSTKNFWGRRYRLKSSKRIVEEIRHIHEMFGISDFVFEHDMFTMNRNKVIQVCGMLKQIGFPISWRCSARVDCLDEELIDIMVDSGMESLFVGIETGSARMQKLIRKNLKLDNAYDLLKYISEKGVAITTSFIYGFPEETEEDFAQTVLLMTKLSRLPHIVLLPNLCAFFPGTELTEQYLGKITRTSVFSGATGDVAVQECEDLISAHPVLFPHFFEFHTEFREKIRHFPQFVQCWKLLRPIYEYIHEAYYSDNICRMLYDFTEQNQELLDSGAPILRLLEEDRFFELFQTDCHYAVMKETAKFMCWRATAKDRSTEVFGFDLQALLIGKPLQEYSAVSMAVTYMVKDGTGKLRILKIPGRKG